MNSFSSDVITVNLAIQLSSDVYAIDKIKFSEFLNDLTRIIEPYFKSYVFFNSDLNKPYLSKLKLV